MRRVVAVGPTPAIDGVVRWRLIDRVQWVFTEFHIAISKQTLSRVLRAMAPAYAGVSVRPRHHAQSLACLTGRLGAS